MRRFVSYLVLLFCIASLLVACRQPEPSPSAPPVSTLPGDQPSSTSTVTPEPPPSATPSPTPVPPPLAVLLASNGSDPALVLALESGLQPAIAGAGLRWEVRQSLSPGEREPDLRLVVVVPPDPGLANLQASLPGVQFLAVGLTGFQPSDNVSLIGPQGFRPDKAGFIAGVAAALITPDWRVGTLGPGDSPSSRAARQGFLNGVVFFCGLCLPYHGPNVDYPVYQDLPPGAGVQEVQIAVQALVDLAVETVYLPPEVSDPSVIAALAQSDIGVIASSAMPPEFSSHWVATLAADPLPAALDLIPLLLSGEGGHSRAMPFALRDVSPDRLSAGRQVRLQEVIADLLAGYIDTGVDPLTGDLR